MSSGIKHAKISNIPDVGNPDLVQPSDWNQDHVIDDGALTVSKTAGLRDELDARQPASPALTSVVSATSSASDADILEYDVVTQSWIASRSPRSLRLDGGNF